MAPRGKGRVDQSLQVERFAGIVVTTPEQSTRLHNIVERQVYPSRWLHRPTLEALGVYNFVKMFMESIGMKKFLNMHYDTFKELTLEFVSSFELEGKGRSKKMSFRVNNCDVVLTLMEFAELFELDATLPTTPRISYEEVYRALSRTGFSNTSHMTVSTWHHPVPRIWHRFAGQCFLGRSEPHNAQTIEVGVIGHYIKGFGKLNIVNSIISHISKVCNTSKDPNSTMPIWFGGLVTRIAIKKANFDPRGKPRLGGDSSTYANMAYYRGLGWLRAGPEPNQQFWVVRVDKRDYPVFTLPNHEMTRFLQYRPSYTYDIDIGDPAPRLPRQPTPPPPPPQVEIHDSPPHASQPPPQDQTTPTYTIQSLGEMMHRMELSIGSIDQRLGHLERNQGRALYPVYNDYARRDMIPPDYQHPEWYQYPQGGYTTPSTWGGYQDYSYQFGYDQSFGGRAGATDHHSFGGFSGGAGPSDAGGDDEDGDDDDEDGDEDDEDDDDEMEE